MQGNKILLRKNFVAMLSIIVIFVAKLAHMFFLPKKYSYDAEFIMRTMNGTIEADRSFRNTASFYNLINVLGLKTVNQWGAMLLIVAIVITVTFFVRSKKKVYSVREVAILLFMMAFIGVYAITPSKEILQLMIFCASAIILTSNRIKSNKKKILLLVVLFAIEAALFRSYYIILSEYIILLSLLIKSKNKRQRIGVIILTILCFLGTVFIIGKISTENYDQIMNARWGVNVNRQSSIDAKTIINDYFGKNDNILIFALNYVLNVVRLLFPFELISKGLVYLVFVIYQLLINSFVFDRLAGNKDPKTKIACILMISFLLTSAIFEPDFGSFARHEACLIPIVFVLFNNRKELMDEQE